ncbi:hypothetical protein HB13667_05975 [Pseudomonas putida]|uniref:Uncharacterized protein n=1 Tax=Pseudomonas putida TaxID=303 RepID=A0A0P7DI53_PSEPU|nr:hypothetical protein [Pseudomonas putida]KPM67590.1 hypothetical protein HB13667_05975 [Pseudomonas putida]
MSIEMTLSFVRAAVQRAEHHGNTNVELNVKDMLELLPLIESGLHKQRAERQMKRAGWASPSSMQAMLGSKNGKRSVRLLRAKNAYHNLEIFFCDKLGEKVAESVVLVAAEEAEKQRREVANV